MLGQRGLTSSLPYDPGREAMDISADEFALAITAFLFLGLVAFSFLPRVELTLRSRATFAIGVALFLGTATLLSRIENVQYPPFMWLLPLVPLAIMGVLVTDRLMRPKRLGGHEAIGAEPSENFVKVRREPAFPGERDGSTLQAARLLRERAANPAASPQELASMAYLNPSLRATIAGNPAAPASLLEWLANLGDSSVRAAINARGPVTLPIQQSA